MRGIILIISFLTVLAVALPLSATIINVPADSITIQAGINGAGNEDTVLVAPGVYYENINFTGANFVLGSHYLTTGDTSYISSTIIAGNSPSAVITVSNGEDSTSQIIGFSIENGLSHGVEVLNSSTKIIHNIFRNNYTIFDGGAINYRNGYAIIAYNIITENTAQQGAAIWVQACSGNIYNNLIYNNLCTSVGSGITLVVCSTVTVNNNTICFNEASSSIPRGVIGISTNNSQISIYNNIIAFNYDCGIGQGLNDSLEISFGYNDIFGNTFGAYYNLPPSPFDLFLDPLFVGGDPFDYHLQENSPCIDAGNPASPPDPDGTIADIGAFYYHNPSFIPGIVSGIVVDENTVPIESVYVLSSNPYYSAFTDTNGLYELAMWGGTYDITFQKSGYHDYTAHDIIAIEGDTVILDVALYAIQQSCTSCVRGFVENRESALIENVYVWAVGTGVDDYTDFIGRYSLGGLAEGTYDVSFSYPYYLDTTLTGILVSFDSATTQNVLLEGNGAITGVVVDVNAQPISGAEVSINALELSSITDDYGEYFLDRIIPEQAFDISFSHASYFSGLLSDIIVAPNDTLVLDTVVMIPGSWEVITWYGNVDGSPIIAPIGDTIFVDLYAQVAPEVGFLHLPLGTDDQYIVDHHSVTQGVLYSTLLEWDEVNYLQPDSLSPGWHSQSLIGFYDIVGGPNPPLQCDVPTLIASFAFEIANDTSLIGDTVDCLTEGYNPANGGPLLGDVNGVDPYYPHQFYSPLYFVESAPGCDYVVGDVNESGGYNGLDVTYGVNYFKGGPAPLYECECTPGNIWHVAGDVNGSCHYNGLDITFGVAYLKGGPEPIPCPDCPPN